LTEKGKDYIEKERREICIKVVKDQAIEIRFARGRIAPQ